MDSAISSGQTIFKNYTIDPSVRAAAAEYI
jgi:hypothetical protein